MYDYLGSLDIRDTFLFVGRERRVGCCLLGKWGRWSFHGGRESGGGVRRNCGIRKSDWLLRLKIG